MGGRARRQADSGAKGKRIGSGVGCCFAILGKLYTRTVHGVEYIVILPCCSLRCWHLACWTIQSQR